MSDLELLRAHSCIRPSGADSDSSSSADAAKKYYCQLELLRRRFPRELMEREGLFDLSWSDAFLNVASGYSEIDYEMAAVLYNTGALHSQLGAKMERYHHKYL